MCGSGPAPVQEELLEVPWYFVEVDTEAQQLEDMRQTLKQQFRGALANGRLASIISSLKDQKQIEQEHGRLLEHGLLSEEACVAWTEASLRQESKAKTKLESLRNRARGAFLTAIEDGRLEAAFERREAAESSSITTLCVQTRSDLKSSLLDGRFADVMATMKESRASFNASLMGGRCLTWCKGASLVDAKVPRNMAKQTLHAATWLAGQKKAQQVDLIRQKMRNTLQLSLCNGEFAEAVTALVTEKKKAQEQEQATMSFQAKANSWDRFLKAKANEQDVLRQQAKTALQAAVSDGRLMQVVASMKKEREAREMEQMRQSMHQSFKGAMDDGRLNAVMAKMKQKKEEKQLETMRQSMQQTFKGAMDDGRLDAVIANMKQKKEAQLESMHQSVQQTLLILDRKYEGGLAAVTASMKKRNEETGLESMRQSVKCTLQTSLLNGRLTEVVRAVKAEKEAKEVQATRQQVKSTLQKSLLDGRLFEVIAQIKKEKEAKAVADQALKVAKVVEISAEMPKPFRPSSAKTSSRPTRHSSKRSGAAAEAELVSETSLFLPRPATSAGILNLAPPASPRGSLPPVIPPCRAASPRFSSQKPVKGWLSAMALDLGSSFQKPPSMPRKPPSMPSAMALDLGLSSKKPPSMPSAMSLDLGVDSSMPSAPRAVPLDTVKDLWSETTSETSKTAQPRSLSSLRVTKTPSKAYGLLPPIAGGMGKASAHKRSFSMDSIVWDVAPAINAHVEWGNANQMVF